MNNRIEKLRNIIDDNTAVFISGYPNIFYYSGFTSEDAYLVISHDKAVIITDSRYTVQAGIQSPDFILEDISQGISNILKHFPENIWYEEDNITVGEFNKIAADDKSFIPKQTEISQFRMFKDKYEIDKIRQAEKIGDLAFTHILDFIKVGMTEREIALELEYFMKKQGASGLSFETIAASGVRSCMPHGVATDKIIENGNFLTLDFGCIFEGYCSDMTRTIAIGSVSDKQREIYDIVLKAQTTAISQIEAGKKCCDIDKIARNIIKDAGYGKYFGHGLGHSVGIEIHESPNLSPKCDALIAEGNTLTVEPGIYIPDLFGVRIEDLVVINNGKCENLTSSPKELIIL